MNTLEISDVYDVYYDGRRRFPRLPQAPDTDKKTSGRQPDDARQVNDNRIPLKN